MARAVKIHIGPVEHALAHRRKANGPARCMNSPSAVLLYTGASLEAEAVMKKAILVLVALATSPLFGSVPARAYYDGPWCGVYSTGRGSSHEKCDYRTFESCRMDIVAGNRGFCRPSQYWQGNTEARAPRHKKARKHAER
jgi:hypothetical protein